MPFEALSRDDLFYSPKDEFKWSLEAAARSGNVHELQQALQAWHDKTSVESPDAEHLNSAANEAAKSNQTTKVTRMISARPFTLQSGKKGQRSCSGCWSREQTSMRNRKMA